MENEKDQLLEQLKIINWNSRSFIYHKADSTLDIPEDRFTKFFGYINKHSFTISKNDFKNLKETFEYFEDKKYRLTKNDTFLVYKKYHNNIEWISPDKKILVSYIFDNYIGRSKTTVFFNNNPDNEAIITELVTDLFDKLFELPVEEKKDNKFFMVAQNQSGLYNLDVEFKEIPIKDGRFDLYYGSKFPYEHLKKFMTDETENLLLLHGDPGTGKSNFIKHLILNSARPVLYIPPTMLSVLSTPSFISYTMQNKGSIIVIEDSEEVISKNRNSATNNLLGLTDGFLKDVLDLKIICTFNCGINDIDEALLRKGRLYFEYKFDKLEVSEAKALSDYLELDADVVEPLTLANLFNLSKATSQKNSFEKRQIGFGVA